MTVIIDDYENDACDLFLKKSNDINDIIDNTMDDFEYQIKFRGKNYYEEGRVKSLYRNYNFFGAKVFGSEFYNVTVDIDVFRGVINYACDCPCEFPCKHIVATLFAIKNNDYRIVDLKPDIKKRQLSISELINIIPAKEIKAYLLSYIDKCYIHLNQEHFQKVFVRYIPSQSY